MSNYSEGSSPETTKKIFNPRKRASTRAILGDKWVEDLPKPADLKEITAPASREADYTRERALHSLSIVDQILRSPHRKLSPLGMRGHQLYKEWNIAMIQLEDTLRQHDEGEEWVNDITKADVDAHRKDLRTQIVLFERAAQHKKFMKLTSSENTQQLMDNIILMMKSGVYARYGDYLGDACGELKMAAMQNNGGINKVQLKAYWTVIAEKLREEEANMEEVKNGVLEYVKACPTRSAVEDAVGHTGYTFADMLLIIQEYATRNEMFHANFNIYMEKKQFTAIAKRLNDDFCDVPKLFTQAENGRADLIQMLINTKIDLWFDRDPREPQDWLRWVPNEKLKQDVEMTIKDQTAAARKDREAVLKIMKQRLRQRDEEKKTLELMRSPGTVNLAKRRVKRVASATLENEKKKHARQEKQWRQIQELSKNFRNMRDAYVGEFGLSEPAGSIVADKSLDE